MCDTDELLSAADLFNYSVKQVINLLSVVFNISQEYPHRNADWGARISPCVVIPNKQKRTVSRMWVSQNNKSIFKTIIHEAPLYRGPCNILSHITHQVFKAPLLTSSSYATPWNQSQLLRQESSAGEDTGSASLHGYGKLLFFQFTSQLHQQQPVCTEPFQLCSHQHI